MKAIYASPMTSAWTSASEGDVQTPMDRLQAVHRWIEAQPRRPTALDRGVFQPVDIAKNPP